jgi:Xaa-Pro aminopeptidase
MPGAPSAERNAAGLRSRIDRFRENLVTDQLEAGIVSRPTWRRYLSGVVADLGILVITLDRAWLFAPDGAADLAAATGLGIETVLTRAYDPTALVDAEAVIVAAVAELVEDALPGRALGVELSHLPIGSIGGAGHRLVDLGEILDRVRVPRDDLELAGLHRAVAAVERAIATASAIAIPGATELDLLDAVRSSLRFDVGDDVTLACNIASGPRTWLPDPRASDRVLVEGDLVLLDVYPIVDGYAADLTRTFGVGEVPTEWHERERAVLSALEAGAAALVEGATGQAVSDAIHRRLVAEAGTLAGSMAHHAGHGIGIAAWEKPWIGERSDDALQRGTVVCLEPGLYEQAVGGLRVEGEFLITSTGSERLDRIGLGLSSVGA